jgi:ERCC4-type nuclease
MTINLYVAPTEPPKRKELGLSSILPERYGVDFLWPMAGGGLGGVQRKELGDLVASLADGRLNKELAQMKGLAFQGLIIEGRGKWTADGRLVHRYVKFNKQALIGVVMSVEGRDIKVIQTGGLDETADAVLSMRHWSMKPEHRSLNGRGEMVRRGKWGKVTDRDYALHLLTSMPGVGVKTAESLLDHFGKVPLRWEVGEEELREVPGIGKVMAKRLVEVLT